MTSLPNKGAAAIIAEIADVIVENRTWLSEIDGKIGDGDHGFNMAKGFGRAKERIDPETDTLDAAMRILSDVLMSEIGGSMGPLYGIMFADMADALESADKVDPAAFGRMLRAGLEGVEAIGSAKVGDNTLLDALVPAVGAYESALADGASWPDALDAMKTAAETGRDSTVDMVARIGRSSRLGERSRGVLDAGAASCCLILAACADGIDRRIRG